MNAFPDTPRGRYAARCHGRCPVHDEALQQTLGYVLRMDLFPSHAWEEIQMANPFCLDLGESLTPPARGHSRETLVWCPRCQANARAR